MFGWTLLVYLYLNVVLGGIVIQFYLQRCLYKQDWVFVLWEGEGFWLIDKIYCVFFLCVDLSRSLFCI